jgi:hypothetical protein
MKRIVLMMVVIFGFVAAALGQCSPSGCPAPAAANEWRELPGDPGRVYLFRNGVQVGGWDYDARYWRAYDAVRDAWSTPLATPPVQPPARAVPNFGVDAAKLQDGARFQLNGREVSREKVLDAIADKIPEESKKFRVTIVGTPEDRKRVADAFQDIEPALKERTALWSVPPDHWSLTDTATGKPVFRTDGKPMIYVQAPNGRVLHRQADFAGAGDFQAIRKAVKKYDDAKDPDLRKDAPAPMPAPVPAPPQPPPPGNFAGLALLLGLLGYLYFTRRR